MNLLMTQYAVEAVTKENNKLRKKLAKQQEEFNNYREELANQVGEELAKQREDMTKQREDMAKQLEDMAKLLEDMAKNMDELCGVFGRRGMPLKQSVGGGVKTEAEFLNGHEYTFLGSAYGEIVNALITKGTTEQDGGGGCERFHCVCGGNVKN